MTCTTKHQYQIGDRVAISTLGAWVFYGTIESINERTVRLRSDAGHLTSSPVWLIAFLQKEGN